MLDTLSSLCKIALDAIAKAIGEIDAIKADLAKRQAVDTSATDATQALYQEQAAAAQTKMAALEAQVADLQARLAAAVAPPEPSDR